MATIARLTIEGESYTANQIKQLVKNYRMEKEVIKTSMHCPYCDRVLPDRKFFRNPDPSFASNKIPVCKDCLKKIAYRVGADEIEHEVTKESLVDALRIANTPFVQSVYDQARKEAGAMNTNDLLGQYFKFLYKDKVTGCFADSDFLLMNRSMPIDEKEAVHSRDEEVQTTHQQIASDREDCIRMIGYDPFLNESYVDQAFLYSQLLGLLDSNDESSDDQMKIQSAISIVRSFLQISKIDDSLTKIMSDPTLLKQNANEINKLQDSKGKIQSGITKLAAESCISLKNAKGSSKGDNTWTGKVKKCKDLSLRASENNGYDLKTCKGMMQCAEISSQAILKALKLDESDYSDMLAQQRERLVQLEYKVLKAEETARILLRENLDLKDLARRHDIELIENLVDLDELLTSWDEEEEARLSLPEAK